MSAVVECEKCGDEIPPKRLELIPNTTLCVHCKSKNDEFKYKMKTVGRDDEPTIAKDKKTWEKLKKQKKLGNI